MQYKDAKVGSGTVASKGDRVVMDWEGYTIGKTIHQYIIALAAFASKTAAEAAPAASRPCGIMSSAAAVVLVEAAAAASSRHARIVAEARTNSNELTQQYYSSGAAAAAAAAAATGTAVAA